MQELKIICPGCKKVYKLKTANPEALKNKTFNCPKCGFSVQFSMLLKKSNSVGVPYNKPNLETHIAGGAKMPSSLKTKVHVGVCAGSTNRTVLIVENSGNQFSLSPGIYILGRESVDSKATLKIAPDPYMSRQHARLTVNVIGGKTQCVLCGLTSANPIFINNKKVASGSQVALRSGDKILLGMTTILFMSN